MYGYEVHVVRYPIDKNAPFSLNDEPGIFFYNRKQLSESEIRQLYDKINPDAVLVSGWIDKSYNVLARDFKRAGKVVIAVVDNQWVGSLRQILFSKIGKYFLNQRFSRFWIPGTTQFEYMRKIGIDAKRLMVGYYSADSDLFLSRYQPSQTVPKKFVYVGRLLDIKGTPTLLSAIEIVNQTRHNDWQFSIIGSGVYEEEVKSFSIKYANVEYKPFLQPEDLARETASGGVFILPSNYDAWGVVVHEFAMLGYPLILSSMVGSRHYFVTPGYNGFIFESQNAESLAAAMLKVMKLDDHLLKKMSERSHLIGKTITTDAWAARFVEAVNSDHSS
jgi:glycosyltransferase involved in cell wall biosynthesis